MKTLLAVMTAGLILVCGLLLTLSRGRRHPEDPAPQIARLRAQRDELRAEVRRLEARAALLALGGARPAAAHDAEPAAAAVDSAAPAPRTPPPPRSPPSMEQLRHTMEDRFRADTSRSDWSAATERRADEALRRSLGGGSSVLAVHCNSAMCRIETEHQGLGEYERYAAETLSEGMWNAGTFSSIAEDTGGGRLLAVSYIAREGRPLPPDHASGAGSTSR